MEKIKRLYIVSFGNSQKYRFEAEEEPGKPMCSSHVCLDRLEKQVRDYLEEKFPGEPLAYFFTPKVSEISWEHRDDYVHYPALTEEDLNKIEKLLEKEVKEKNATSMLNNNPDTDMSPGPKY